MARLAGLAVSNEWEGGGSLLGVLESGDAGYAIALGGSGHVGMRHEDSFCFELIRTSWFLEDGLEWNVSSGTGRCGIYHSCLVIR